MKNKNPNISFSRVGLGAEQRDFVNSVITGTGCTNPLESKLRSLYLSVTKAITQLNTAGLLGNDIISQDYQDLFQLKLQNLELAITQYWKHSNKLSGVVDGEIVELSVYDAIYATTTPAPPRKSVVVGGKNGAICYPQTFHTAHSQPPIYNRFSVTTHTAASNRMVGSCTRLTSPIK